MTSKPLPNCSLISAKAEALCVHSLNRKIQCPNNKAVCKKRHLIENLFAKTEDWRRIHTRYDRCAHTFVSAILIKVTFIFSMCSMRAKTKAFQIGRDILEPCLGLALSGTKVYTPANLFGLASGTPFNENRNDRFWLCRPCVWRVLC